MSVEFKLFGDLTIKQFIYLLFGGALVFIGISSKLPFYLRGLLIFTGGLGGLSFAFLPLNDRGMDEWIISFFKAVFSPTQRVWQKEPEVPRIFMSDYANFIKNEVITLTPTKSRKSMQEYISGIKSGNEDLDAKEIEFLKNLQFDVNPPQNVVPTAKETKYVEEEPIPKDFEEFPVVADRGEAINAVRFVKKARPFRKLFEAPKDKGEITLPKRREEAPKVAETSRVDASVTANELRNLVDKIKGTPKKKVEVVAPPVNEMKTVSAPEKIEKPVLKTVNVMTAKNEEEDKVKGELEKLRKEKTILEGRLSSMEQEMRLKKAEPEKGMKMEEEGKKREENLKKLLDKEEEARKLAEKNLEMQKTLENLSKEMENMKKEKNQGESSLKSQMEKLQERLTSVGKEKAEAEKEVEENRNQLLSLKKLQQPSGNALEPEKTTESKPQKTLPSLSQGAPNVINGIVKSRKGKLLEGALVIVKDEKDEPVRALKSNTLGQFAIATPVPNGKYRIYVTYEGESFDIIEVVVNGQELEAMEVSGNP